MSGPLRLNVADHPLLLLTVRTAGDSTTYRCRPRRVHTFTVKRSAAAMRTAIHQVRRAVYCMVRAPCADVRKLMMPSPPGSPIPG
jgi:hypothetical protein